MGILIKNGRVIDPARGTDTISDVYIKNGIIQEINPNLQASDAVTIIDATSMWVVPGLIDMHVHLRDPGWPNKETIASGTAAAAVGGFTTICPMANTNPVTDDVRIVEYILSKAKAEGVVHVAPIGSATIRLEGREISPILEMKAAGICAISDDGKTVENTDLYKAAMEQAAAHNLPVLSHCEDLRIADGGHMNAGACAQTLGIKGISNESEASIISRDIELARETGVRLHICHVSTAEGLAHIRAAQNKGLPVTAEVCPHHFTLADEDIPGPDTNFKMSPPLRSNKDVDALKQALKDGTISVIATDHAPHHIDDKSCSFEEAANGIIGLETAVPLCITELISLESALGQGPVPSIAGECKTENHPLSLTPLELIAKLTINPAQILGLDKGTLTPDKMADITIIDPNFQHKIDKTAFRSKSRNTPFHGRPVRGKVMYTIIEGRIIYDNRQAD